MNPSDERPTIGKQLFLAAEKRVAAIANTLLDEIDSSGFALDTVGEKDHGNHSHYYQIRVVPISERKFRRLVKKITRMRKRRDARLDEL